MSDLEAALGGHLAQIVKLGLGMPARFTSAPPLLRRVLDDVRLDELQQHVGHVVAAGRWGRLEGVVQLDRNLQVHSFNPIRLRLLDGSHPLSGSEVSISGYE